MASNLKKTAHKGATLFPDKGGEGRRGTFPRHEGKGLSGIFSTNILWIT